MKLLKKKTFVAATAVALSSGIVGTAHAGAVAFSSLTFSSAQIFNSAGNQWNVSDFSKLGIGNTATDHANLTGFTGVANSVGPSQGNVDVPMACLGAQCASIGQNDFNETNLGLPTTTGQFARGDSMLAGSIIAGVPGVPNSATTGAVAEVQLNTPSTGTGGSFVGTNSSFKFSLASSNVFDFRLTGKGMLDTFLQQPAGSAQASYGFSITIKNLATGAIVFNWAPNGDCAGGSGTCSGITGGTELRDDFSLNNSIGVTNVGLPTRPQVNASGSFEAVTNLLSANTLYSLSIAHNADASATAVAKAPEPATLGIMGMGLFGIAMSRRRKKIS
jgi:hypothetical protein